MASMEKHGSHWGETKGLSIIVGSFNDPMNPESIYEWKVTMGL